MGSSACCNALSATLCTFVFLVGCGKSGSSSTPGSASTATEVDTPAALYHGRTVEDWVEEFVWKRQGARELGEKLTFSPINRMQEIERGQQRADRQRLFGEMDEIKALITKKIGPAATPDLARALAHSDHSVRMAALEFLRDIAVRSKKGMNAAIWPTTQTLRHEDDILRIQAAWNLVGYAEMVRRASNGTTEPYIDAATLNPECSKTLAEMFRYEGKCPEEEEAVRCGAAHGLWLLPPTGECLVPRAEIEEALKKEPSPILTKAANWAVKAARDSAGGK